MDREQWNYVDSKNNPVDHGSRRLFGKNFCKLKLGFIFLNFCGGLWRSVEHWSKQTLTYHYSDNHPEVKQRNLKSQWLKLEK